MDNMPFTSGGRVTGTIVEPSFTRTRHRHRGPRESEKFNLDASSLYGDIVYLTGMINALDVQINLANFLEFGIEVAPELGTEVNVFLDHMITILTHWTPTDEESNLRVEVANMAELRDRISAIESRIKNLENG